MDPVTSIITLATFVKDLLELGQKIKESIEKVSENRRRNRELANDVLRSLADIANLLRGHCGEVPPALLGALGDLKADMLHVLEICRKIQPAGNGTLGFKVKVKMWLKRDEVETEISRLKDRVLGCYIKFTAFSTARTELQLHNLSLRVEHASTMHHAQNQVGFRRLEGMVSRILLDEHSLNRTVLSDSTHIEIQYLEVQTKQLIGSLHKAMNGQKLVLDTTAWDPTRPFKSTFVQIISSSSVVHKVLETILTIQRNPSEVMLHSMTDIMLTLGIHLANLGMIPAAIAWELSIIQVLRQVAGDAGIAWILGSLEKLSRFYQYQTQYTLALGASQEFLDSCRESEYGVGSALTYPAHLSRPLFANAVGFCEGEFDGSEEEAEFHAVTSSEAFFTLAQSLSAEGRHLDAYSASTKGFKALLGCRGRRPPRKIHMEAFVNQLSAVGEGGTILCEALSLFCDLTRVYPDESSVVFLRLLYAYVFTGTSITLREIPQHKSPLKSQHTDLCSPLVITALQALYVRPWETRDIRAPLLKHISHEYLDEATSGLERVISSLIADSHTVQPLLRWVLDDILDYALPAVVADCSRCFILQIAEKVVQFFRHTAESTAGEGHGWCSLAAVLGAYSRGFWLIGRLTEALSTLDEAIARIRFLNSIGALVEDGAAEEQLRAFQLSRAHLLYDMDRIPEALEATASPVAMGDGCESDLWSYYLVRTRVLRRAGRYQAAADILRGVVAMGQSQKDKNGFDIYFPLLLVETAIVHLEHLLVPDSALKYAEKAVAFCRRHLAVGSDSVELERERELQNCALIHSLTTLSDCLAALGGKPADALAASREATDIYSSNASYMWGDLIHTIRKEELGGNAFRSVSLRLGGSEEGRKSAENAIELYRRLVALAPRHLEAYLAFQGVSTSEVQND
ncbi:hypothetical protein FB45DRAFT_1018886 [Roridomyces roridus]|uniref:Uncharacterized protein n=1 Tax=Roridomyces roridus TaxID=1738132 RepID=A0AAD7CDR1_9AGAR|nr:hypothetical protein FB45DRAFT_1018886 [Roridomyces roridus]